MLERFVNGRARSNAYLFMPDGARAPLVVDPGVGGAPKLVKRLEALELRPSAVMLTHGHPDHTWTARAVSERYGVPVYLHRRDWRWLDEPATGGYVPIVGLGARLVTKLHPLRPARLHPVDGEQVLDLEGAEVLVAHTPGHTAGSVCYMSGDVCFAGDTVFASGRGHTIYPGGERAALRESIRRSVATLPDEVRLMPGHGPPSTVGRARATWET